VRNDRVIARPCWEGCASPVADKPDLATVGQLEQIFLDTSSSTYEVRLAATMAYSLDAKRDTPHALARMQRNAISTPHAGHSPDPIRRT
jgi:hypothetical protein